MKKLFFAVLFFALFFAGGMFSVNAQNDVILDSASGEIVGSTISPLQAILNALPVIPIAGNNLKFEFIGETWTARVNGENFSAGTIVIEDTGDGGTIIQQTHIWPGAVGAAAGRVASRIPGAGAVGGALTAAGNIAGAAVGAVEAPGTEIVLEYKKGPPASLKLVSFKNAEQQDQAKESDPAKFNTLGVSVGSSFADPAITATVHGSYSPIGNLFIGAGFELGFVSLYEYTQIYYSIYPYINIGLFLPFNNNSGWYVGAGSGYMFVSYTFNEGVITQDTYAADFSTGFIFLNAINVSYSLRTNFFKVGHKLSVGYVYRFK